MTAPRYTVNSRPMDVRSGIRPMSDPRPTRSQILAEFRRAGPLLFAVCVGLFVAVTFLFVAMGWA